MQALFFHKSMVWDMVQVIYIVDTIYMHVCVCKNIYSQYNPRETIINVILSLKHFSFSVSHEGRLNFPAIIYMAVTTANRLMFRFWRCQKIFGKCCLFLENKIKRIWPQLISRKYDVKCNIIRKIRILYVRSIHMQNFMFK